MIRTLYRVRGASAVGACSPGLRGPFGAWPLELDHAEPGDQSPNGIHIDRSMADNGRMAGNQLNPETLAKEYKAGATIRELADVYGVGYGTVRTLLVGHGVTLRRRGGRPAVARVRVSAVLPGYAPEAS